LYILSKKIIAQIFTKCPEYTYVSRSVFEVIYVYAIRISQVSEETYI